MGKTRGVSSASGCAAAAHTGRPLRRRKGQRSLYVSRQRFVPAQNGKLALASFTESGSPSSSLSAFQAAGRLEP